MAHFPAGDCNQTVSIRQDDLPGYRFGQRSKRHARGRSALQRANSYLKALIQSIADAKFRRVLRELELRGTRLDMQDELWTPDALRHRAAAD